MYFNTPLYLREAGRTFQLSTHSPNGPDNVVLAPGQAYRFADLKGPAIIQNMWFTLACSDPYYLRKVVLRLYWDEEAEPSVNVPFGDFFGSGFGIRTNYHSQYVGVTSGGFYSYIPMPFQNHARLEIVNESSLECTVFFHLIGQQVPSLPDETLYLHASWRREKPTRMNVPFTVLEAEGRGYYAGVQLFMQGYHQYDKMNFLEGDEFVYIDGESDASIKGTGTEDYFQGGWYFSEGVFHAPYHGLTLKDELNSRASCYRFHFLDRIHFDRSIRIEFEHGQRACNEAKADYSCTAYWYQTEPHRPLPELPPPEERERIEPEPQFVIPDAVEFEYHPEGVPYYMSTYQTGWSNQMARLFPFRQAGDGVDHEFTVNVSGIYEISANYIENDHNGLLQLSVDGTDIGIPVDTYCLDPKDDYLLCRNAAKGLIRLGAIKLFAGAHRIRIRAVGKHTDSKGFEAIVDCVVIRKQGQHG